VAEPPQGVTPLGRAVAFQLESCEVGESVTITVDFNQQVTDPVVYKVVGNQWVLVAGASVSGSQATYTVTDGGSLDADGIANGVIVDPVTLGVTPPAAPPMVIPMLPLWALVLLGWLTAALGVINRSQAFGSDLRS